MNDWRNERRSRHDVITIPVLWLAFVLSLLVHIAALWHLLPDLKLLASNAVAPGDELSAPLTSPSSPVTIAPPVEQPPTPAPPVVAPAPPATTPPATDLSAFIANRRRERGEADPSTSQGATADAPESDIARRDRIVAQNLASVNTRDFGKGTRNSGGIFQITKLGSSDAEFTFFGWNKDINRRASQRIEVRQGSNPDIRIAVVREMISIIRRYENEDFVWESRRVGRNITLSARAQDTRELETFMLREFFDEPGLRQ